MAITYSWTITQLDCYPQAEGETNVVFTAHWTCSGTDGAHNASVYSTTGLNYVAGSPYTPYNQLTQAQVVGWVQEALGAEQVAAYEANVATQIANQINPPVVTPPLPWVNPVAATVDVDATPAAGAAVAATVSDAVASAGAATA